MSDSNTQKEEKRSKKRKNRLSVEEAQISETEPQNVSEENNKKQKIDSEAETESENSSRNEMNKDSKKRKKIKVEVEPESENSVKNEIDQESSKKRKKSKIDVPKIVIETESEDVQKEENNEAAESTNDEGVPEKKKKKKRKRKHHAPYEVLQTVDMGLQVMGKKDWKKLRNKYLELQRAKMKQLKQNIKRARWNQWGDRNKMETEHEETTGTKKESATSALEFKPNLIVKIELNEPCIDPKGFKVKTL